MRAFMCVAGEQTLGLTPARQVLGYIPFLFKTGLPRLALYSILEAGFELQKFLPQAPECLGLHAGASRSSRSCLFLAVRYLSL